MTKQAHPQITFFPSHHDRRLGSLELYTAEITANIATLLPLFRLLLGLRRPTKHLSSTSITSSWGNALPTGTSQILSHLPTTYGLSPQVRRSRTVHFAPTPTTSSLTGYDDLDSAFPPQIFGSDRYRSLSIEVGNAFHREKMTQGPPRAKTAPLPMVAEQVQSPTRRLDLHKSLPPLPPVPCMEEDEFFRRYLERW